MRHHANFYTNRLAKEWLKNGKIIIACDLDDTIIPYNEEIKEVDIAISRIKNEKTIIKEFYHEKIISVDTFNMSDIDKFFTNRYGQY